MKKLLLFLAMMYSPFLFGQATQLSGTLNNPDGTGYNGQLIMSLAQQASINSTGGCGGPALAPSTVQLTIKIVNGTMTTWTSGTTGTVHSGAPAIYGSDCTLPYGVPYNVTARDNNGNTDFTAQWLPMGTTQNIGTIQTVINPLGTLFGLSLSDLALTSAANTFSQNQTFGGNITVAGSLTVNGPIYGPVAGPVVIQGTGGTYDLQVDSTASTPLLNVQDNGNVIVTTGYLAVAGVVNSNTGFTYNGGGGSTGQCLVSNGAEFVPGTCTITGSEPTIYYQTILSNGNGGYTQRANLSFLPRLTVTDNGLYNLTAIDLAAVGTAGTYTYPSTMTVDAYGRVQSVSSGTSNTQIVKTAKITVGICTTGSSAYATCSTPVQWPTAFADANYTPTCTPGVPTNVSIGGFWIDPSSVSASGLNFWIENGDGSGAHNVSVTEIFCIGVHN